MIYYRSDDPVLIKKIYLNVWTLRDEVQSALREKMKLSKDHSQKKINRGMCILSEIGMNRFSFFSHIDYLEGQSIVIEFLIPQKFSINAEVICCRSFDLKSKIIGKNRLPFRINAQFSFLKSGERAQLRQFVKSIGPDLSIEKEKGAVERKLRLVEDS